MENGTKTPFLFTIFSSELLMVFSFFLLFFMVKLLLFQVLLRPAGFVW